VDGKIDAQAWYNVSIHAPGEGSDAITLSSTPSFWFQSTLPVKGATTLADRFVTFAGFQSTLPVKGATSALASSICSWNGFNPRSR